MIAGLGMLALRKKDTRLGIACIQGFVRGRSHWRRDQANDEQNHRIGINQPRVLPWTGVLPSMTTRIAATIMSMIS